MTVYFHELRTGRKPLIIWGLSISLMIVMCVLMYPDMKSQMDGVSKMFAGMGSFTAAFGMDRIDFATPMGFYGIECGNILGIGGAFYAAVTGISMLSKEEHIHTAEFLFSHPVSRKSIIAQKYAACVTQLILVNLLCFVLPAVSFLIINEDIRWSEFILFHTAQFFLQLEIASVCFGISSFLKHSGAGAGVGVAAVLYFLNIFDNISEKAKTVKYITPFSYADAADIISENKIDTVLVLTGMAIAAVGVITAFIKYSSKDLAS